MKIIILSLLLVSVHSQYDCRNRALTPTVRRSIVDQHNALRSSVARGASGLTGQNIYAMTYDCTLEEQAQAHSNRCVRHRSALESRPAAGENFFAFPATAQASVAIRESAIQWWNQINARPWNGNGDNVYTQTVHDTLPRIDMWAQMAWGATTRVGCGFKVCNNFRMVVCQYLTGGPQINQVIFPHGAACLKDTDCTTFTQSTCNVATRLCHAPTNANPIPVTTTAGTTATTVATTTTVPPQTCTAHTAFDDTIRASIVKTHNDLRSQIAKGTKIGNVLPRGCKNMFALKYDCALEQEASDLTEKCGDAASVVMAAGLNSKYIDNVPALSLDAALAAAFNEWADQIKLFKVNNIVMGAAATENSPADVGLFAQMAWSRTTKIGCAFTECDVNKTIVVCKYTVIRVDGEKVYDTVGTKFGCISGYCSAVQKGATCNTVTGLCEEAP